jgi:cholest-4-en-3-one 26-monooxygenase
MTAETADAPDLTFLDSDTYANGDPSTFGLPLDQYDWLRENEPMYRQTFDDPLLIDEVWVASRHADVLEIDKNRDDWAADQGYVNIWQFAPIDPKIGGGKPAMLTLDGAEHSRNRKVAGRGFNPKTVQRLAEKFQAYATRVVDDALDKGTFNFVTEIAHVMPMEALGDVLGVPEADRSKFFSWVDVFAAPFDPRVALSFEHVQEAIGNLMAYSLELADLRRREPGDDVMSNLVAAEGSENISQDELMGNVVLLASGAAESTRTSLSHGLHELMRRPDAMAWLRERADDVPMTAVQEIVRISSPFTHLVRTARRDMEWHGKQIAAGDRVAMLFAAANFDPAEFENPREFDMSRDPNPHFSFGRGPHKCLGQHVAALEIKILLGELLRRTRSIEPAGDISYVRDSYSRGVFELPVTVEPA